MSDKSKPNPMQVQIDLDPSVATGAYVNMAMVNHTETEITLDFIYVQPQEPKGTVRSRIITSPKHARRYWQPWRRTFGSLSKSTDR